MPAKSPSMIIGRTGAFRIYIPVTVDGQRYVIAFQFLNDRPVLGVLQRVIMFLIY
ncbi:hypothetical protein D3C81_2301690 [compost metagenome]